MLIACVQTDVVFGNLSANTDRAVEWIEKASSADAKLVVMPECMLCGYAYDSRAAAMEKSISIDSEPIRRLVASAAEHQIHLTLGFLLADGDRLFNASALIGPQGVVSVYRKVHLPQLGVDRFVDRGDQPYSVHEIQTAEHGSENTGDLRIGMAICYDCSFPEPMRVLGIEGADVIALGTNWPVGAIRTAEIVPPARSMENHLFFVAANRVGAEGGFTFCGHSSICGPDGVVLAASHDDRETMLVAEIDPAAARNKRIERTVGKHVIHRMNDRRPEFYDKIVDPNEQS